MHVDVLKFVRSGKSFTKRVQSCRSVEVHAFMFVRYICWLLYVFPLVPTIVKIVLTGFICLNIQFHGVFCASVNSLETDKRLLYL